MPITIPISPDPTFFAGVELARAMLAMVRGQVVSLVDFAELAISQYGDELTNEDVKLACSFASPPHTIEDNPSAWVKLSQNSHEKLKVIKARLTLRAGQGNSMRGLVHTLLWKRSFYHHSLIGMATKGDDASAFKVVIKRLK